MKKSLLTLAMGLAFTAAAPAVTAAEQSQPNLVIFYADDLGYGDLGSYGHPVVKTPNIDKLAAEGVQFNQYYAPAPLCSPSRAGFLTGRTPYRTGIRSWIPKGQDVHLGENEVTLANKLQDKGYDTAVMGKLHLNGGLDMADHPQAEDMGFDYTFVLPEGFVINEALLKPNKDGTPRVGKVYPDNFYRNGKKIEKPTQFSGGMVGDEVVNWLENQGGDNPFFLYVPFTEVHTPIASPQKYLDMYSDHITKFAKDNPDMYYFDWVNQPYRGFGEYYANISYLDAQVGRIMDKVKAMGEEDNTIFIFASDNGPVTREARKAWELNMAGETGGLRGRKDNLLEGGIRVPGIIKYSQEIKRGQVSDEPVTGLDIMPTLAELMDFDMPTDRIIDGQSIVPVLKGESIERAKPLIWTIDMPNQDDAINEWAIRDGDWKLILDRDEQPKYLFNIKKDPYEVWNKVGKEPEVLESLMKQFEEYKHSIENDSLKAKREAK